MDRTQLEQIFSELLGLEVSWDTSHVHFASSPTGRGPASVSSVPLSEVEQLLTGVEALDSANDADSFAFSPTTAEFLVEETRHLRPLRFREDISLVDASEGLTYRLGKPSPTYALFLANRLVDVPRRDRNIRGYFPPRLGREQEEEQTDAWEALSDVLRVSTLLITSEKKRSRSDWESLADSFYFQLGYNLDFALIPRPSVAALTRSTRIQRLRRATPRELEAPRRTYVPELVRSYQLALSAESAMLSYLSYYHVAEHWFEDVFLDEISDKLQAAITSPAFSSKRKKDIRGLIRTVSSSLKSRDDEVIINESTALKLTLSKFLDLPELVRSLEDFDPELVARYASTPVGFSGGDAVDLRGADRDSIIKGLAQRIYKTRNALVHRKDGAKSRFTPFKDDAALQPELPLMRFVAEQITIGSSTVL